MKYVYFFYVIFQWTAFSGMPTKINFQSRLIQQNGIPVSGTLKLILQIGNFSATTPVVYYEKNFNNVDLPLQKKGQISLLVDLSQNDLAHDALSFDALITQDQLEIRLVLVEGSTQTFFPSQKIIPLFFAQRSAIADEALMVKAENISGKVTQDQIDATLLQIPASNLVGKVQASQVDLTSLSTLPIGAGQVNGTHIADGSITNSDLVDATIESAKIHDAAITQNKIADNAVVASKLQAGSVEESKLASNSVSTVKLQDASVTTAKLVDGSVTAAKLAAGTITEAKISSGTLTHTSIMNASLYPENLNVNGTCDAQSVYVKKSANEFVCVKCLVGQSLSWKVSGEVECAYPSFYFE